MNTNHQFADRYKETAIRTANPLQLIVILYDAAIQGLQEAQEHLSSNNIAGRARCTNRSVAIISELQACLNFQAGSELADSLDRLYSYMRQRIFKANVDQKAEPLAEVITLLSNLRSAWGELASQSAGRSPADLSVAAPSPATLKQAVAAPTATGSFNISG
jgi:flagellar secretion chaperone FliS